MAINTSWKPVSVPDLGGSSFLSLAGTLNKNAIEALNNITSQAQKQLELQQQQKEFEVKQGLEQLKFELEKDKFNKLLEETAWEHTYKKDYLNVLLNKTKANQLWSELAKNFGRKPYQPRTVDKEEYQFTADMVDRWVREGKLKPEDRTIILNNLNFTDPQLGVLYKAIKDEDTILNSIFGSEKRKILQNSYENLLSEEIPHARNRRMYNDKMDLQGQYYGTIPSRPITNAVEEKKINTSDTNKGPFGN